VSVWHRWHIVARGEFQRRRILAQKAAAEYALMAGARLCDGRHFLPDSPSVVADLRVAQG
jgi:hypothetical protein